MDVSACNTDATVPLPLLALPPQSWSGFFTAYRTEGHCAVDDSLSRLLVKGLLCRSEDPIPGWSLLAGSKAIPAGEGPERARQARGRVPAVVREALQKGRRSSPARGRSLVEALEVLSLMGLKGIAP